MEREKKERVGGNRESERKLEDDRRSWRTVKEQRVGKHRKAWRELKGLDGGPLGGKVGDIHQRPERRERQPGLLTFTEAAVTDPAIDTPRLTTMSPLDVVTATVTGVGRREGITGRGRSPGRLFPLTTAAAQL